MSMGKSWVEDLGGELEFELVFWKSMSLRFLHSSLVVELLDLQNQAGDNDSREEDAHSL
jgi:hypothetical protein